MFDVSHRTFQGENLRSRKKSLIYYFTLCNYKHPKKDEGTYPEMVKSMKKKVYYPIFLLKFETHCIYFKKL